MSWHRYYTRFWKQSAQLCDFRWPDFLNLYGLDKVAEELEKNGKLYNTVDKLAASGVLTILYFDAEVRGSLVGPSDFKSDVGR